MNGARVALQDKRRQPDGWLSLVLSVAFAVFLTLVGQRLFVDATAAVCYNADERIDEAVKSAWVWALFWGFGNGAVAYFAYRVGICRLRRGPTRLIAAGLLVLDLSFLCLLALRGGGNVDASRDIVTVGVMSLVLGSIGVLAWRRPLLGGVILFVLGGLLALGALYGSATYRSEAADLLFDEDMFFFVTSSLIALSGGLSMFSSRYRGR